MPLLNVENITVRFQGIVALDSVSFEVAKGEITGLIGPNGAGKTTLFNCLSRLYSYSQGHITFDGHLLDQMPRYRTAEIGIGRTFQNLALYKSMSVTDNIKVGAHCRAVKGFLSHALCLPGVITEETKIHAQSQQLLELLQLEGVADRKVADLPFGTQKRVEFARALASKPKMLLLDEPAAGLNHTELSDLAEFIRTVRDDMGITVLLVEHHMSLVMEVSDWIVVLNFGKKIAEGTPEEIQRNPEVIRAYLGDGN